MEIVLMFILIVILFGIGFVLGFKYCEACTKALIEDGVLKINKDKI